MSEFSGFLPNDPSLATVAVHGGHHPDECQIGPVVPPIAMSSTYKKDVHDVLNGYKYARNGNPSRDHVQHSLAKLEGAKYGHVFSSGTAAITTLCHLLKTGDHLVTSFDLYVGTYKFFRDEAPRMGIDVHFLVNSDLPTIQKAITPRTRMLWIETPSNPMMKLVDLGGVASILKSFPDVIFVVDNTFMTPYFQRPLALGADLVVHSCSKYLGGHSDIIMGAGCTNREDIHIKLEGLQINLGAVPPPFDCYLLQRSLKTLAVRMEVHMRNGLAVAKFLEKHPAVDRVMHPALESHPQHELAKRQCFGHSGMLSFCFKNTNSDTAQDFLSRLKLFSLATSLGGTESTVVHMNKMTYCNFGQEELDKLGIPAELLRVSVGLESHLDLIRDLDQAING